MNGKPAQDRWQEILSTSPTTLTEILRFKVAKKALANNLDYAGVGRASGLSKTTVANFAKCNNGTTSHAIDALGSWVNQ
jgi:hypothetical protein